MTNTSAPTPTRIVAYVQLTRTRLPTSGVGRHIHGMVHGLARTPRVELRVLASRYELTADGRIPETSCLHDLPVIAHPYRRGAIDKLWKAVRRPQVDGWTQGADWVYSAIEFLVPTRQSKLAVTVHDVSMFEPELPWNHSAYAWRGRWGFRLGLVPALARADVILAVSEFTKGRLVELFGANPGKIHVVGNGVEERFFAAAPGPTPAPRPYLLLVGGMRERKGAAYVLPAAALLAKKHPEMELWVAGLESQEVYALQARACANIKHLGPVPDADLPGLMRGALGLLFLSRYEGFGIPIVEAMAAGTPAIVAQFSSLPEIGGDAALQVDALQPAAVVEVISELYRNPTLRAKHIELGRRRAELFRWECCANRARQAMGLVPLSRPEPSREISVAPRQRRVAWILHGSELGGALEAALGLATAVAAQGWETRILMLSRGPATVECDARGIAYTDLGVGPIRELSGGLIRKAWISLENLSYQKRAAAAMVQALQPWRPEALHVMWATILGAAGPAARRLGVPCFWEVSNALAPYPLDLNRRLIQWQAHRYGITMLANSRYTASTLGDRPVRPIVSYLGVDARKFDPTRVVAVARSELGIPPAACVLGIFGRIVWQKGQEQMIRGLQALGPDRADVHLVLLGEPDDPAYGPKLEHLTAAVGLRERVHFVGRVRNPERYYALVDVAVNSRLDPEPFGLSVVEAMMMGRPVLVHASGGPAETVLDGVTGWHVLDASVEGLAAGLRRALADRARWAAMGAAARARALELFNRTGQVRRYQQIVETRLAEMGRGQG